MIFRELKFQFFEPQNIEHEMLNVEVWMFLLDFLSFIIRHSLFDIQGSKKTQILANYN